MGQLDALDVFAGTGNMAKSFRERGLACEEFEKLRGGVENDVLTPSGSDHLLGLLCRVSAKGVVWLGPPCSTWVWIARSHTKRNSADVNGDTSREDVQHANATAKFVGMFMRLCHRLKVWYVVEQPKGSLLWQFESVAEALQATGARRTHVELGRVGASSENH